MPGTVTGWCKVQSGTAAGNAWNRLAAFALDTEEEGSSLFLEHCSGMEFSSMTSFRRAEPRSRLASAVASADSSMALSKWSKGLPGAEIAIACTANTRAGTCKDGIDLGPVRAL